MNAEKLKRLQMQVRIGGKGTARRKKKVIHQTATTDDKKLQSSLKKLSVSTIPGIEEVNIIKDDLTVIHFNNPKAQASLSANTFAVTGHGETKKVVEMLPEILPQLGQETVVQLRMFANSMTGTKKTGGGIGGDSGVAAAADAGAGTNMLYSVVEEDDVPMLVSDFDEVAKIEAAAPAATTTASTDQMINKTERNVNSAENKEPTIAVSSAPSQVLSNTKVIDNVTQKQPLENLNLNKKLNEPGKQFPNKNAITNENDKKKEHPTPQKQQINKKEKDKTSKDATENKITNKTPQKQEISNNQSKAESKAQKGTKRDEVALEKAGERKGGEKETVKPVKNVEQAAPQPANIKDSKEMHQQKITLQKQEQKQEQEKELPGPVAQGKQESPKEKPHEQKLVPNQQQKQVDVNENKEKSKDEELQQLPDSKQQKGQHKPERQKQSNQGKQQKQQRKSDIESSGERLELDGEDTPLIEQQQKKTQQQHQQQQQPQPQQELKPQPQQQQQKQQQQEQKQTQHQKQQPKNKQEPLQVKQKGTPQQKQKCVDQNNAKQKVDDHQHVNIKSDSNVGDVSIKTVALQSLQSSEKIFGMVSELTKEVPAETLQNPPANKNEVSTKAALLSAQQQQVTASTETAQFPKIEEKHIESTKAIPIKSVEKSVQKEKIPQNQLLETKLKLVENLLTGVVGPEQEKNIPLDVGNTVKPQTELKEDEEQANVAPLQSKEQSLALVLQSQPTPSTMSQKTVVQQLDKQSSSTEVAQTPTIPSTPLILTSQSAKNSSVTEITNKQQLTMAEILQSQPIQTQSTAASSLPKSQIIEQQKISSHSASPNVESQNLTTKLQVGEVKTTGEAISIPTTDINLAIKQKQVTEEKSPSKSMSSKQKSSPPKQIVTTKAPQDTAKQQQSDAKFKLETKPQSGQQQQQQRQQPQQQQQQPKTKPKPIPNKSAPTTPSTPTKVSPEKLVSTSKPATQITKSVGDATGIKKANSPQKQQQQVQVDAAGKSTPKQIAVEKNIRQPGSNVSAETGAVKKANTPQAVNKTNVNTVAKQQDSVSQAATVGSPKPASKEHLLMEKTASPQAATDNTAITTNAINEPSTLK